MSLIRPQVAVGQEATLEMTLEMRILKELGDLNESHKFLRVMLLGGMYGDMAHDGRLPQIDMAIRQIREDAARHEERTKSLEDDRIRFKAAVRTAASIAGVVGAVTGTAATLIVNLITRH